mmetsp:Transcript_23251/g.72403  ORF Transcript_23251/g.72403 Transcript_23251/m.72403 type:complete len:431 (+) Transcript_23251:137-1429(+)
MEPQQGPGSAGAHDGALPERILELLERQSADLKRMGLESATFREELAALRSCLVDAGVLSQVAFLVKLHKRRFQAALAAHPLCSRVRLDTALSADGVGVAVGLFSGRTAIFAAGLASRNTRTAARGLGRAMRDLRSSRVYVCGGSRDGIEVLDSVECFNTASQTWEALPSMLERRVDASAHVIAGRVYVCGGCNGEASQNSAMNSVLNTVERFDPCAGAWEAVPPMLFARKCAAAGVIEGKLYVCGGFDATEQALDLSECVDPHASTVWEALPLMLEPRAEPSSGVVGRRLYVCGGRGGVWVQLNSAEAFDPAEGVWQRLPPMREPRSGATAAAVGVRLYVCGGMGNSMNTSVECFDTRGGFWEVVTPGTLPRYGAAAAAADGRLYVVGGSHGWQQLASAECFDPESRSWTSLPCMSERRLAPAVAASLA